MMTAFTTQVLPSTTAALLMFCTSSSMNAAPRKKKCQLDPAPPAERVGRLRACTRPRANSSASTPASRKYSTGIVGFSR